MLLNGFENTLMRKQNLFLTKAEAKRHIRLNKHHYTSEAHT